jgi:hypothetical protein
MDGDGVFIVTACILGALVVVPAAFTTFLFILELAGRLT